MNKRYLSLASMVTLCFLLLLISGCGTSGNKEGTDSAAASNVGDTACVQCHSANTEALTGQGLIAQYQNSSPHRNSAHANNGNGCEACHGSASQHQGKGPISYVNPYDNSGARCADCHAGKYAGNFNTKFASSNHASVQIEESPSCVRCHTHEGAVLGDIAGLTGDLTVMDNKAYQTIPIPAKGWSQFKCQTCHEHGGGLRTVMARYNNPFKADAANGTVVSWDPNNNREHDAYDLCTSCHSMTTNTYGTGLIGSNGREISASLYMASGTPDNAATGKPVAAPAEFHIDIDRCMNCGYCAEYCPFDAIRMDREYELASRNRSGHVYNLEKLGRPLEYHAQIHPAAFAREEAGRAQKQARRTGDA